MKLFFPMGYIYLYVLFLLKVIAISTSVFLPYMVKPMGLLSKSLFRFYFSAAFKKTGFMLVNSPSMFSRGGQIIQFWTNWEYSLLMGTKTYYQSDFRSIVKIYSFFLGFLLPVSPASVRLYPHIVTVFCDGGPWASGVCLCLCFVMLYFCSRFTFIRGSLYTEQLCQITVQQLTVYVIPQFHTANLKLKHVQAKLATQLLKLLKAQAWKNPGES